MSYELKAIFIQKAELSSWADESWYKYLVQLSSKVSMLPLHEPACRAIGFGTGFLDQYFESTAFEQFETPLNTLLPQLSKNSVAALLIVSCFGGACGRKGVVYCDRTKIYDRYVGEDEDQPAYVLQKKGWVSKLIARCKSEPIHKYVANPSRSLTVAEELFANFGFDKGIGIDTFNQLGLGLYRKTEDWLI
tara:strand:+ start:88 stop:660 length:573 start_codon:yes stop_codon:yes gene_type:complete